MRRIQTSLTLNQLQIFSKNNIDIEQNNKTKQNKYYHYLQNVCNVSVAHVNKNKELTQAIRCKLKKLNYHALRNLK